MARFWFRTVSEASRRVFSRVRYIILTTIFAFLVFSSSVWIPNYALIMDIFKSPYVSIGGKVDLLIGLWGSIVTNFTTLSASYTIFIAIFSGIYTSMLVYYLSQKRRDISGDVSLGVGGIIAGAFGIGCAACGSFLFATLLSFAGASGAILLLPLEGMEFGILGVMLLAAAITLISKKITDPAICPVR